MTENTLSEDSTCAYPNTNLAAPEIGGYHREREHGIPSGSSEEPHTWARRGYISDDHVETPRAYIYIITESGVIYTKTQGLRTDVYHQKLESKLGLHSIFVQHLVPPELQGNNYFQATWFVVNCYESPKK